MSVAAVGEDQLEVVAAQRLRRPPAVLDHPLLADRLDGDAVDRGRRAVGADPTADRARARRAVAACRDARLIAPGRASAAPSARARARRSRPGGPSAAPRRPARRGPRAPPAPSRRRRGSSPPTASSSWSPAGGPRPSARSRSASAGPGSASSRGDQQRAQDRRAEAVGRPSPCSTLQLPPPREHGRRGAAPSRVLSAPLRRGEQAVDQQLQGAVELAPGGPLRQLDLRDQLLVRSARAQRLVLAAGEAQRPQAERAEAVGDLVGAEPRRARPRRAEAEPLQGDDQLLGLALGAPSRAAAASTRSGARKPPQAGGVDVAVVLVTGGGEGREAGRGDGDPDRHARSPRGPPRRLPRGRRRGSPRSPSTAKKASPGRSDSTAAPIPSSARTIASVRLGRLDRVGKQIAPGPGPPGAARARRSRQATVDYAGDLHTNVCSYSRAAVSRPST